MSNALLDSYATVSIGQVGSINEANYFEEFKLKLLTLKVQTYELQTSEFDKLQLASC